MAHSVDGGPADRGSRSDWGGRSSGSDHYSHGSRSISDSFGESMERAGYERVNEGGGWREHDSDNSYRSTSDRMNRHLDRYGFDYGYTNDYNRTFRSGGFGGNSGRRSVIGQTASSKYHEKAAKSLSSASITDEARKSLTEGVFGRNVQGQYSPDISSSPYDQYSAENFSHINNIAANDFYGDQQRKNALNSFGGLAAPTVASSVARAIGNPVGALGGAVLGMGVNNAGDIANEFVSKQAREGLNKAEQAMYDRAYGRFQETRDKHRDDLGDKVVDFIGGVFDAVTGNPFNAGSNMANAYNNIDALNDTAKDFPDIPAFNNYVSSSKGNNGQTAKEREKWNALNHSESPSKGILNTMHKQLNINKPTTEINKDYNEIPMLFNFWNNLSIK